MRIAGHTPTIMAIHEQFQIQWRDWPDEGKASFRLDIAGERAVATLHRDFCCIRPISPA